MLTHLRAWPHGYLQIRRNVERAEQHRVIKVIRVPVRLGRLKRGRRHRPGRQDEEVAGTKGPSGDLSSVPSGPLAQIQDGSGARAGAVSFVQAAEERQPCFRLFSVISQIRGPRDGTLAKTKSDTVPSPGGIYWLDTGIGFLRCADLHQPLSSANATRSLGTISYILRRLGGGAVPLCRQGPGSITPPHSGGPWPFSFALTGAHHGWLNCGHAGCVLVSLLRCRQRRHTPCQRGFDPAAVVIIDVDREPFVRRFPELATSLDIERFGNKAGDNGDVPLP